MTIDRSVPNIRASRPAETRAFFVELLGFQVAMDMDWVVTVASPSNPSAQVTIVANQDPAAPGISVEVDDVDAVHAKALDLGLEITYPIRDEEWGVRRFMLREPSGTLVNVLSHRRGMIRETTAEMRREEGMAETARDLMTEGCECIDAGATVTDVARKLAELNVGAMPICGDDDKLKGMLTDRDIAVKVVAEGRDPSQVTAGDLAQGVPVTVGVDDSVGDVVQVMGQNQVRRVPVLDGDRKLVGIVSQADVAKHASADEAGNLVEAISAG